jgi:hypothetical protein
MGVVKLVRYSNYDGPSLLARTQSFVPPSFSICGLFLWVGATFTADVQYPTSGKSGTLINFNLIFNISLLAMLQIE